MKRSYRSVAVLCDNKKTKQLDNKRKVSINLVYKDITSSAPIPVFWLITNHLSLKILTCQFWFWAIQIWCWSICASLISTRSNRKYQVTIVLVCSWSLHIHNCWLCFFKVNSNKSLQLLHQYRHNIRGICIFLSRNSNCKILKIPGDCDSVFCSLINIWGLSRTAVCIFKLNCTQLDSIFLLGDFQKQLVAFFNYRQESGDPQIFIHEPLSFNIYMIMLYVME